MNRKDLIVNHPLFRLIGPIVSGSIIYLLILLLYNNLEQILDTFISKEFIVCVVLALIVSESSRLIAQFFAKLNNKLSNLTSIVLLLFIASGITVIAVIILLQVYFRLILGYTPDFAELQIFLVLYIAYCLAFMSIYLSGHFVQKAQVQKLENAEQLKLESKENFKRFTRGINTELLFESLETIIAYVHSDKEKADDIIDDLSVVYRYTLSKNQEEVIKTSEELNAVNALVHLVNHLPYRGTKITKQLSDETYIIPGTIIYLVEEIIKSTIARDDQLMEIKIIENETNLHIEYHPQEKLNAPFDTNKIMALNESYQIFTGQKIVVKDSEMNRTIVIPKLNYKNTDQ